jgi:hypothetical protein
MPSKNAMPIGPVYMCGTGFRIDVARDGHRSDHYLQVANAAGSTLVHALAFSASKRKANAKLLGAKLCQFQ